MKKKYYIYLSFVALVSTVVISCTKDDVSGQKSQQSGDDMLLVSAAQQFFENGIAEIASRSGSDYLDYGINPGDFVPYWNEAIVSKSRKISSVDIPIRSGYSYRAIIGKFRSGSSTAFLVPVPQKLLVVKEVSSGKLSAYILSLVPETAMSAQEGRTLINRFVNTGDKNGFSGIVIYSRIQTGEAVRIDKYHDGRRIDEASFFCSPDQYETNLEKMQKLLSATKLFRAYNIDSRGSEENPIGDIDLPEIVVTPDKPEDPWDPWDTGGGGGDVDPSDPPVYQCLLCGSPDCSGDCFNPGGEGDDNNETSSLSALAQALINSTSLDPRGQILLNQALAAMSNLPIHNALLAEMQRLGFKVTDVVINPQIAAGGFYDAVTNTITFQSNSTISFATTEEMLHFGQNNIFPEGIQQHLENSRSYIEFEVKIIADIANLCGLLNAPGGAMRASGGPDDDNYTLWLQSFNPVENPSYPTYNDMMTPNADFDGLNYWQAYLNWQEGLSEEDKYKVPAGEMDTPISPQLLEFLLDQINKNN